MSEAKVARRVVPQLDEDVDTRETIIVATSIATIVLAFLFWVSRIGFATPLSPIFGAVGISLFVCAVPFWLMRLAQTRRVGVGEWWTSQPALTLFCILVIALVGMASAASNVSLVPLLRIPGAALAIWTILRWLRRGRVVASLLFVLGTAAFTVWTAGVVWGSRYKMPLFWETLELNANVHHDPLYNVSIGNMLDTYGVASTGLDGIPLIRYHYGSAWLFSKLAHLIGTDLLSFYSLGYPIIVIPLFFGAILLLAAEIRGTLAPEDERPLRTDYRLWIVFVAATIGLIPTDAQFGIGIWNANVLISESYLIAVPVFLLVLATGIVFSNSAAFRSIADPPGPVTMTAPSTDLRVAMLFLVGFLPLAVVVCGFLKLSLMVLLLATIVYVSLRLSIWHRFPVLAAIGLCVIATALTYPVVAVADQNGGVSPLNFMRYNLADGWQQFFPVLSFMWTWVYVGGRLWEDRIGNVRELAGALRQGNLLDVEVVVLIAVLGFLPGEVLAIHGGSGIYFSDVQRWLSLAFILSRIGLWWRKWRDIREARGERVPSGGWRGVRLSTVLAVFVAAPFAVTLVFNSMQWPTRVFRSNVALRTALASKGGGGLITDPGPLGRGVRKAPYYPIVTALREIERLPMTERRKSLLFIPQSYRGYWGMFDPDQRCAYVSMIATAISTVALADGMPARGCVITNQYNMPRYKIRTRDQSAGDVTPQALCTRARAAGFSQVLVLAPDGKGMPRRSRIPCGG